MSAQSIRDSHQCLTLDANVIDCTEKQATIALSSREKASCQTCQQRGGCQSLSVYHWFFEKKHITLPQPDDKKYRRGEQLHVSFLETQLQRAVLVLLGTPLLGFIAGVSLAPFVGELSGFALGIGLATTAFYVVKKHLHQRLLKHITIR